MSIILYIILIIYFSFLSSNSFNFEDNKYKVYNYIPEEYKLETKLLEYDNDKNNIEKYPIVIKPVYCNGLGNSVEIIKNEEELKSYINTHDKDEIYIIQEFYKCKYEFGLLYEKLPFVKGKIISLTLKSNINNEDKLLCQNVTRNGTNCENKNEFITEELTNNIIKVSNSIPGFNVGRYDICADSFDELQQGKFKIFEVNGNMGFDLNNFLPNYSLSIDNIKRINHLLRWFIVRVFIGLINILRLKVNMYDKIININKRYKMYKKCNNWEWLFTPSSA